MQNKSVKRVYYISLKKDMEWLEIRWGSQPSQKDYTLMIPIIACYYSELQLFDDKVTFYQAKLFICYVQTTSRILVSRN